MDRREFIKAGCTLCMAVGAGAVISSLSACASLPVYKTEIAENKITVPVSLFAQSNLQIIRANNYGYDIALRKEQDETFVALLMRCTHADNQLISTGNGFTCSLHGSNFSKEGAVTKGPAEYALKKFGVKKTDDSVVIYLT